MLTSAPFAFRVLDSIQPFQYLTVLILPKSPSPYPKKNYLEIFLNKSKNPKNYFHAKPFGKSFNHIGNRPFFKFQSQKGKIDKIIDTTLHFRTKTSDFFFFFHQLKCQYCFPCQTLWKIIYSYWEEAIFQVSEPESKNQMSHEKKLHFVYNWYGVYNW